MPSPATATVCPACKGTGSVNCPPAPAQVKGGASPRTVYTCGACAGSRVQLPAPAKAP